MKYIFECSFLKRTLNPIFDFFALPDQKNHPVLAFELKSLLFLFSIAQFFMLFYIMAGLLLISHPSIKWAPLLITLSSWISIFALKLTSNIKISSNILIASILLYISYFCFLTNGFQESTFAWFIFIPVVAGILTKRIATLLWSIIVVALVCGGNFISYKQGFTNYIAPNFQSAWSISQQISQLICIGLIMVYLMIQRRVSTEYLRKEIISQKNLMRILVHDISNPLSTIHLSAQLLLAGSDEMNHIGAGKRIQKNSERIISIIQLLRDLDGWGSGKKKMQLSAINISFMLDEVISIYQNRLTSKNLKLNLSYSKDEHAWAHPTMLAEQIFGNLLGNAIKFSFEGSTIDISIEPTNRQELTIVIRDYGIGIPFSLQKILFDPLASTTRIGTVGETGTGFGLPITKECVTLIGGRIQISGRSKDEYPQDHGTRVVLVLKRADGASVS